LGWEISEHERNCHSISFDLQRIGTEAWFLLLSDVHFDSKFCRRDLLKKHLDQAVERDALVLDNGDFFDVMQGKFDPRSDKYELRPELIPRHKNESYLSRCVDEAAEFLEPYKDRIALLTPGNHETSIHERHDINMTQALADRLRIMGSRTVHIGGYSGYVVLRPRTSRTQRRAIDIFYHHGWGGGADVTKGMIQFNRAAANAVADITWLGHIHERTENESPQLRRTPAMRLEVTPRINIFTPGYKDDYDNGMGGYGVKRGKGPKPLGGAWLHCYPEYYGRRLLVQYEDLRAR
jgi:hypothetical protein